jgi:ubiquinone/menaquinone biosynthesis C-methylase UbiE
MDARFQRRIQRYGWDKAASVYEQFWRAQIEPAQSRLLELAALQPAENVLDVACGTGLVSFHAAERVGDAGRVSGTDISEHMVEAARTEAVRRGLRNAAFERCDSEQLPFPANSFNAALCSLGLMYFPDPAASLRQMFIALAPDGRAVAAVWGERERCGWAGIFPVVDARVQSEVCPMFFQLGTGTNLEATFGLAGFRELRSERLKTVLHYDSAEEACGAAFAGGPVALAYSRFNSSTRASAHREYLDSIERFRTGTCYDVPGEFVVTFGRK